MKKKKIKKLKSITPLSPVPLEDRIIIEGEAPAKPKWMKIYNIFIFIFLFSLYSCGGSASHDEMTSSPEWVDSAMSVSEGDTINFDGNGKSIKTIILPDSLISKYNSEKIGDISHLIKDTMFFSVPDTVELTVSYKTPVKFIIDRVGTFNTAGIENVSVQKARLTPVMEAKLIDPTGNSFEIIPITDQEQIVEFEESTFTLWQWRVTPLKGGSNNLVLNVNMIVGDHTKSIKIYEDKIYVYINPMDRLWFWIKANWEYLTYAIGLITGLIGFIYKEKIRAMFKKNG